MTADRQHCHVCEQEVTGPGPWCDLYTRERGICSPVLHVMLEQAEATGDGPMVNAICEVGRRVFGPCLHW